MNSLVGKSTGIALLLAAGILAALFAMGVFSATGVFASTDAPEFQDEVDLDGDGSLENMGFSYILLTGTDTKVALGSVEATIDGVILREGNDAEGTTADGALPANATEVVRYALASSVLDTVSNDDGYSIDPATGEISFDGTATAFDGEADTFMAYAVRAFRIPGATASDDPTYSLPVGGAQTSDSATVNIVPARLATTETTPGKSVELTVHAQIDAAILDKIVIDLGSFGVPSSIDKDNIRIAKNNVTANAGDDSFVIGNPSAVTVSGTKVTLTFGDLDGDGENGEELDIDQNATRITFLVDAGITLPARHNIYDIGVSSDTTKGGTTAAALVNRVDVQRTVTVDEEEAIRGTDITVTGKGFADGSAEVYVVGTDETDGPNAVDGTVIGSATVSDGSFTLTVSNESKTNFPMDTTVMINAEDSTGMIDASPVPHSITATFAFSSDEATPGQKITITLKDVGGDVSDVKFRSGTVTPEDEEADSFKIQIPSNAPLGASQVSFTVGTTNLKKNITIVAKPLELTPTTAVPGQEIRIEASGFSKDERFFDNDDGVDTNDGSLAVATEDALDGREPEAVSDGSISITVNVPAKVTPGEQTVKLIGDSGRVATATLTVPEPEITLNPAEGLRGSDLTVSGTGFPANDFIQLKYQDFRRDSANPVWAPAGNTETDSEGNFEVTIKVPSYARIGQTQKMIAITQLNEQYEEDEDGIEADHSTPDPEISLNPSTTAAGSRVTVTGANYPGFSTVTLLEIGGVNVTPIPSIPTDAWGAFTAANVQVPQLNPAQYTVKLQVGGEDGPDDTVFIQIVEASAVASTVPAEVFADLIDSGRLARVWYLNQDNGDWQFFDPALPAAINTLSEVPMNEVVVVIVTDGDRIDGVDYLTPSHLLPGTNNRFIN